MYACVISAKRSKDRLGGTARLLEVDEKVAKPPAYRRAVESSREQRLEQGLRSVVLFVEVRERRFQDVGCLALASRNEVQHGGPVHRAQARRSARRRGALQVLGGVGIARVGGGEPQLEQHLGELRRLGPLSNGALQVAHGACGVAECLGAARGRTQRGDRPLALARLGREQVRGHGHRVGVAVGEHARCLLVRTRALHRGHVVLDGGAQDRVPEAQARGTLHKPRSL